MLKQENSNNLNLVFMGPQGVGKSSVIGKILYDNVEQERKELEGIRERLGEAFDEDQRFAYLIDDEEEEKEKKMTINSNFKLIGDPLNGIVFIDSPGSPQHTRNMIGEISRCEVAVMVIPGDSQGFKDVIASNDIQRFFYLAMTVCINEFVVVVNFREGSVEDEKNKETYTYIKNFMMDWMQKNCIKTEERLFVPINAMKGENIDQLYQMFLQLKKERESGEYVFDEPLAEKTAKPLRLPVARVLRKDNGSKYIEGTIEYGRLAVGMFVRFSPNKLVGKVSQITRFGKEVQEASAEMYVSFIVQSVLPVTIKRGMLVSQDDQDPVTMYKSIAVKLLILDSNDGIRIGDELELHFNTSRVLCKLTLPNPQQKKLFNKLEFFNKNIIKTGESGVFTIQPLTNIAMERHRDFYSCGKFTVFKGDVNVACGIVKELKEPYE